jgi:hypothetical protein
MWGGDAGMEMLKVQIQPCYANKLDRLQNNRIGLTKRMWDKRGMG